jgi:hypothetical protein
VADYRLASTAISPLVFIIDWNEILRSSSLFFLYL